LREALRQLSLAPPVKLRGKEKSLGRDRTLLQGLQEPANEPCACTQRDQLAGDARRPANGHTPSPEYRALLPEGWAVQSSASRPPESGEITVRKQILSSLHTPKESDVLPPRRTESST
jgi:hypothetical protein